MRYKYIIKSILGTTSNLEPKEWGLSINENDCIVLDGVILNSVSEEYQTPLHVISKNKLINNCQKVISAFTEKNMACEIYYSYKTNCVPMVLQIIHQQGIGAEVISDYELWLALQIGVLPENIIYNGPDKSEESLELCVKEQIKALHIDSLDELNKLLVICKKVGKPANIGLRIRPTRGWVAQLGLDVKSNEVSEAVEIISQNRDILNLKGVHVHLGSQVSDIKLYTGTINEIARIIKEIQKTLGISIEYVDLGGGFGVPTVRDITGLERILCSFLKKPFSKPETQQTPTVEEFGRTIIRAHMDAYEKLNLEAPKLVVEPGRLITSNAEILLLKVKAIKRSRQYGSGILILDGGRMNITVPTYFEYHEIIVINNYKHQKNKLYSLYGRTCTPSDLLYKYKYLSEVKVGDILAVMDAGAYFTSFANSFAFARPGIVLIDGGKTVLARERESFESRILLDRI